MKNIDNVTQIVIIRNPEIWRLLGGREGRGGRVGHGVTEIWGDEDVEIWIHGDMQICIWRHRDM